MIPSIQQICALAFISDPGNCLLSSTYISEKRSSCSHFLRWVVFIITFGQATLNKKLDLQVEKITQISKKALQSNDVNPGQKLQILGALKKLIIMSQKNFGKKHSLLVDLIQQHNSLIASISPSIATQSQFLHLSEEISRAQKCDAVAPRNSWKKGLGHEECEQTLAAFLINPVKEVTSKYIRQSLKISIFGSMTTQEKQLMKIIGDYLQALHGIPTVLDPNPLPLQATSKREKSGNWQYAVESQLKILQQKQGEQCFSIGFTNQDLFVNLYKDSVNFIMGVGLKNGYGLFSTYRLGSDFNIQLNRLMKLAAHEFGHMRGIDHCTEVKCNMQGSNSVQEMDAIPLIFCAQDMAKICYLNNWSLKEGYQRQLNFFETFSMRYNATMDFTQEIAQLRSRIDKIDGKGTEIC